MQQPGRDEQEDREHQASRQILDQQSAPQVKAGHQGEDWLWKLIRVAGATHGGG